MQTYRRLSEVFDAAEGIPFDDASKIIFFSDTHRGVNDWADDFAHNQDLFFFALRHYFREGFTYIEVGDGDELYENREASAIQDAHSHIFWLMREFFLDGRLYMIFGNHDAERQDPRVVKDTLYWHRDPRTGQQQELFNGIKVHEGLVLHHTPTGGNLFVVHGHQGDAINDQFWKVGRFFSRLLWRNLQLLGLHDPTSPAKNFTKRTRIEKKVMKWVREKHQPTLMGHTHRPAFPRQDELPLFNDGCCVHPRCITGIEIQQGQIALIKWWVTPDDEGRLRVTREELEGPRTLRSIFE